MQRSIFAGLFLVSILLVPSGGAQLFTDGRKPVWTMEFIKVKPGMFGYTLGYLDDNWMREAKRQGAVLSYHRIAEQTSRVVDPDIALLTEIKSPHEYYAHKNLLDSIRERLPDNTSGAVKPSARGTL